MKITLNRETLLKRLLISHSIVGKKNVIPITGNSLITFDDSGKMYIKTTNVRTSVSVFMEPELIEGETLDFICDTRTIQNVIQTLRSETIYIEVKDGNIKFGVEGGRRKVYSIPLEYSIKDFPTVPEFETKTVFSFNGAVISALLLKMSKFINRDDIIMPEGYLFDTSSSGLNIYAFTNTSVSHKEIETDQKLDKPVYIHYDLSTLIDSFKASMDVKMAISSDGKLTHVFDGTTEVFIKNIEGKTANPSKIIEGFTYSSDVRVSRVDLTDSINRASSMLKGDTSMLVKMKYIKSELLVSSEDLSFNCSAEESVGLESNNKADLQIGADYKKLSNSLSVMSSDFIDVFMSEPSRIFKIIETDKTETSIDVYMMPMIINE